MVHVREEAMATWVAKERFSFGYGGSFSFVNTCTCVILALETAYGGRTFLIMWFSIYGHCNWNQASLWPSKEYHYYIVDTIAHPPA